MSSATTSIRSARRPSTRKAKSDRKPKPISKPKSKPGEGMDWRRARELSDGEVVKRARTDPDNPPLTKAQLTRMKRTAPAKKIRWALRMSQEEFARVFRIPLGTLRDWEQHRAEPDQAARAYLAVISRDPQSVIKALAAEAEAVA